MALRVLEIFRSIQGESTRAGRPCAFVRLAGCPLACSYCDTPEARDQAAGSDLELDKVCEQLRRLSLPLVEITGGEPLAQRDRVERLARCLLDAGHTVMLETSGCFPLAGLDARLEVVMDVKTPGSGMAEHLCKENLGWLDSNDEVKCVITNRADYDWTRAFLAEHALPSVRAVHLSPAWGRCEPAQLAGWLRVDPPTRRVRLTLQLHRLLGVP